MRRTRAVAITALAAVSALVVSACGNTGQQGGASTPAAPPATSATSATSGPTSSDGGSSTPSSSEGTGTGGSSSSGGPSSSSPGGDGEGEPACGTPHGAYDAPATKGGNVNVSFNEGISSWNNATAHGNSTYNANVAYLTQAQSFYYNDKLELVNNDQYLQCTLVSKDPLTVKYTLNKAAKWSDGVPVSAADLLLTWASSGGHYNTGTLETDDAGVPLPTSAIAFDVASPAMELVTKFPELSDDGFSMTIVYDKPFVDYPFQLQSGIAAHVVAQKALGIEDPAAATAKLIEDLKAFDGKTTEKTDADGVKTVDASKVDKAAVADVKKISDVWNTGFDFTELPADKSLFLSTGPYVLSEIKKDQYMTFVRNPEYDGSWGPVPSVDQITYRIIGDAMASVQALQNQEVDIIQPQATVDVLGAANNLKAQGVTVLTGDGATYEHVDLAQNNGGPFDPKTYGGDKQKALEVRQAFLKTIPRQQIVDRLIKPLNPDAVLRQSFNVVPGSPDYDSVVAENGSKDWSTVDIEGAKALLAKAGVTSPKVRFMYADKNVRRANEYKLISESAAQAGFQVVDGKNADWSSQLTNTKIYDAALFGWQSTAIGASQIPPNFITGGQNNFYGYSNKTVDGYLNELNVTPDPAKQKELILNVEKALFEDAFGTVIFQFPDITAFNANKVKNVSTISLAPTYFWNFWEWTTAS
ncbi:MAG: ABC transporter family substrate-binding protein [Nakamurella sp.]